MQHMICLEYILDLYHMSQTELADALGIKKQNLTLWLKGKQDVSKKHLPAMEEIFGIPQEYFQKELTDGLAMEIQYLQKFGKPIQGINESTEDDFNMLEVILSNYEKGIFWNPTTSFMFQIFKRVDDTLIFQKYFSYDKIMLHGNTIKKITYPDDLFEEVCDIEILLNNNEEIKLHLFNKRPEMLMGFDTEDDIIEPQRFIDFINQCQRVSLKFEYSDSLNIIHVCDKWDISYGDDKDDEERLMITFFPKEIGEFQRFSLMFNESMDNIRIHEIVPGIYTLDIFDAPFTILEIRMIC